MDKLKLILGISISFLILWLSPLVSNLYCILEGAEDDKEIMIEGQLDKWCIEYGLDPERVVFMGYTDLGDYLGIYAHNFVGASEIWLDDRMEDMKLGWLETSILWHEFCHAECFLTGHFDDLHGELFQDKLERKMIYWLGHEVRFLLR